MENCLEWVIPKAAIRIDTKLKTAISKSKDVSNLHLKAAKGQNILIRSDTIKPHWLILIKLNIHERSRKTGKKRAAIKLMIFLSLSSVLAGWLLITLSILSTPAGESD